MKERSRFAERTLRAARVRNLASRVFTTDAAIADWFQAPAPALNYKKPAELLDTDAGAREVEAVLHGIAYGNIM